MGAPIVRNVLDAELAAAGVCRRLGGGFSLDPWEDLSVNGAAAAGQT